MTTKINITFKVIFWLTIVFIVVAFYALTFGQTSSYEFADWKVSRMFYDIIMQGLPIAILLTLTGTIKKSNNKSKNRTIIGVTILGSVISFFSMVSILFSIGFLTITNDTLLYKLKTDQATTIVKQTIGQGALGSDGHRIVKLEPFLKLWNKVTKVDTTNINKTDWLFLNEKIDARDDGVRTTLHDN